MELVSGGSVINGAYPLKFYFYMLFLATQMRDMVHMDVVKMNIRSSSCLDGVQTCLLKNRETNTALRLSNI